MLLGMPAVDIADGMCTLIGVTDQLCGAFRLGRLSTREVTTERILSWEGKAPWLSPG